MPYLLVGTLVTLLFAGVFCVVLFLVAAVLMIDYKQITEGFDDHARFCILQHVGMSRREVCTTINQQVLMVFFLPLGMAPVHILVPFPVLCNLLRGFNMHNTRLLSLCTIAAAVLFALFYGAVYHRTSKTYYRIVQES